MLAHKTLSLSDCDINMDGGEGRFAGYASVFGGVDSYGDTIVKGAYEYTLKKNGKPKMFLQHDSWSLPIGKWLSAKEDNHGLFVEGELTPGLSKAQDTYAALKHGTLDGLSIGYMLKAGDYEELSDGTRLIKRVSDLVEVSPVVFPADSAARVDLASVKTAVDTIESIRDFERLLREVGSFDQATAKLLVAKARTVFAQRDVGESDEQEALEARILAASQGANFVNSRFMRKS